MKVYKIRLNPEDADYGDAWSAAVAHSQQTIFDTLPPAMQRRIERTRKDLPLKRADACCTRCAGDGYRNDREDWVVVAEGKKVFGKVCFQCNGSGIEPHMEPVWFRRRVMDIIKTKSPAKLREWAKRVIDALAHPYRCVLLDIAKAVLAGEDPTKLPH